jgi:S1-C subfamily serine protease
VGALLNSSGQAIGMNTAAAGSSNGSSAQNIGFAIPSGELTSLVSGLRAGGDGSQSSSVHRALVARAARAARVAFPTDVM